MKSREAHFSQIRIDLVSDTATRPSPAMRQAMMEAPVGDEQRGEDPSVNELNARVAELLGQEAAIFLPSGTMCNQIALAVHCRPGDEVIATEKSHIIASEGGGAAVFSGSGIRAIKSENGIFTPAELLAAIRLRQVKSPRSRLVVIEQTSNRGGGSVWPLGLIVNVVETARDNGLLLHMDGARLMNAVVASGIAARNYTSFFDSVWLDLSKGLGCPIGSVLAGGSSFIEEANIWKHRFGGAMRQAGILAAAGLYALEHNVERLAQDHENARSFAASLAGLPGIHIRNPSVESNLVFIEVAETGKSASEIAVQLQDSGVRIGVEGKSVMRAVFHLDVDAAQTQEAADAFSLAIGCCPKN